MNDKAITQAAVAEINQLHRQIMAAANKAIERAIRIGELLAQEKVKVAHGGWLGWLKANVEFNERTAQRYMRVFQNRATLKSDTASDWSSAFRHLVYDSSEERAIEAAREKEFNRQGREYDRRKLEWRKAEHSKETIAKKADQYKAAVARIESLGGKVEELHLSADEVIWLSSYSDRNIQMALPFCAKGRDLDTVRELAQAHLRIEMAANLSEEDRTWLREQPDQDVIEAARYENRIEEILRCARVWVPRRVKYKLRAATNMVARQAASRLNLSDLAKFEWLLGGKGSITFLDKRHVWTIQLREATAEDADKIPAFERAITERTGEVVLAEQEQWKREEAEGRNE